MLKFKALLPDALLIAGAAALSYGVWLIHPASGIISAGVLTIAGGIAAARA